MVLYNATLNWYETPMFSFMTTLNLISESARVDNCIECKTARTFFSI